MGKGTAAGGPRHDVTRVQEAATLLFALRHGHEGDFYRAPGTGAEQLDADFLANGGRSDYPLEVGWCHDSFAVKTDNHITGNNAGLMRRLSRHDFIHVDP